jgi:hypothetical protein
LGSFAAFVQESEFFALQNPQYFRKRELANSYSKLWMNLEVLNALALDDWDQKGRPEDYGSVWDSRYRSDALYAVNELLAFLDRLPLPSSESLVFCASTDPDDAMGTMTFKLLDRNEENASLTMEIIVTALWDDYAQKLTIDSDTLREFSMGMKNYPDLYPCPCSLELKGKTNLHKPVSMMFHIKPKDTYTGYVIVEVSEMSDGQNASEVLRVTSYLGFLERFGRRLNSIDDIEIGEAIFLENGKRLSQKSSYPSNSKKPQAGNLAWRKLLG